MDRNSGLRGTTAIYLGSIDLVVFTAIWGPFGSFVSKLPVSRMADAEKIGMEFGTHAH